MSVTIRCLFLIPNSIKESLDVLNKGDMNKKIAETKANDKSSRSHTILRIDIIKDNLKGQINLVDLAGSEGVNKTETQGVRLREGGNINKSLLSLSNVISKLSQNQKQFINYRDSKLTRLLQNCLNGNSRTFIICTINQSLKSYYESWSTIKFGSRAKNIKTIVKQNENKINEELILKENSVLKSKIKQLEGIVSKSQSKSKSKSKSPIKSNMKMNYVNKNIYNTSNNSYANVNETNSKLNSLFNEFSQLKNLITQQNCVASSSNRQGHPSYSLTSSKSNEFFLYLLSEL